MSTKFKSVSMRFVKGFLAGGLASVALVLNGGLVVSSVDDLKSLGGLLFISFVSGGLLALEKMLTWQENPPTL